jgi:hypothetical protein
VDGSRSLVSTTRRRLYAIVVLLVLSLAGLWLLDQ